MLTAEEYGAFVVYQGWLSILSGIMTLEIGSTALYSGFARYPDRENDFTKSAVIGLSLTFLASLLPFFAFSGLITEAMGADAAVLWLLAANILADGLVSAALTRERFVYGYKAVFAINFTACALSGAIGIFSVAKLGGAARIVGASASSVITAAFVLPSLISRGKADPEMCRHAIRSGATLLPMFLSGVILTNADRLIIADALGRDDAARYSVAHSVGLLLTFATTGLLGALKPWIIRKLGRKDARAVKEVSDKLLNLTLAATAILLAVTPELFGFLAPRGYEDALFSAYLLAASVIPMLIANVGNTALVQGGRNALCSLIALSAAATDITLCILLVPRFGVGAGALAFLLSYLLYAALGAIGSGRECSFGIAGFFAPCGAIILALVFYMLRRLFILRLFLSAAILPIGLWLLRSVRNRLLE